MSRETKLFGSDQNMSAEKDALSDPEANHRSEPDRGSSPLHDTASQLTDNVDHVQPQWLQGFPLVIVMMALTIVSYLMLLDVSIVSTVGSLACALATSSNMLITGRALAGMGSSGISTGCVTIMAGIAPLHKRSFLLGIMMGISQIGLASGPLVGGALSEYTTWRWCFWINLPIGAVLALLVVFIRIPDTSPKQPPISVLRTLHKL
ncbi:hypothetical protein QQS21_011482 [Conoideocrella luteorostrata]|uniref:Major facilitator superfamily (MFS) profile domain-containing protein n=1 Tax=Conoideocrella luteorostrata TaxID=1105319 RepID=A0AAJ0FTN7_9HYPO|nr:hypothetical protein QQS21_011482 [Conoideocrella luteorostrata]